MRSTEKLLDTNYLKGKLKSRKCREVCEVGAK